MSNSFERFKKLNQKRVDATENKNASFIFSGYPSTVLDLDGDYVMLIDKDTARLVESTNLQLETTDAVAISRIIATVVNQQEKDTAYIYTKLDEPLAIGSTWNTKGLHWMIAEEIIVIHDVKWHKYLAYLCNVEFEDNYGYFIGPEKSYVNVQTKYQSAILSQQKPVLVLPHSSLNVGDKVVLKGRPWLIQEYDDISTEGVTYYSLAPTTVSKEAVEENADTDTYIVPKDADNLEVVKETPEVDDDGVVWVSNNTDITLSTKHSIFEASATVNVVDLQQRSVTFQIPFGVNEVEITTYDGTVTYKVED